MKKNILLAYIRKLVLVSLTFGKFYRHINGTGIIIKNTLIAGRAFIFSNVYIRDSFINDKVRIDINTSIIKSKIHGNNAIGKNCVIQNSEIYSFSYLGDDSNLNNVIIGKFCSIGPNFKCGYGRHPTGYISTSSIFYSPDNSLNIRLVEKGGFKEYGEIRIGNDVWIGANVFVGEDVNIGDGAIIGAGAIVVKDVPPYAVVGGVPAKVIRYRFNSTVINSLLKLKWWDKDLEWLSENIELFNKDIRTYDSVTFNL